MILDELLKNLAGWLRPIGLTTPARHLNVPRTRIGRLAKGETSLTVDTPMRHTRCFGTTPECRMNLQRAREPLDLKDITPLRFA